MASRIPAPSPFANANNALTLVIGSGAAPRMIALRPWAAGSIAVLTVILMLWYLVATLYFVFRDEMLGRLVNQQTEMQHAYEDRLAALRNQIDRVTSRQLVDQNSIDSKLQELLSRHAQLEARHAMVAALAEQPSVAAIRAPVRPGQRAEAPLTTGSIPAYAAQPRPLPAPEAFDLRMPAAREPQPAPPRRLDHSSLMGAPPAIAVAELRDAADRIERQQMQALDGMERQVRQTAQRFSQAFAETGLDAQRFAAATPAPKAGAQGGPLVPIAQGAKPGSFEQRLNQAQFAVTQAERMRRIVGALPLHRPMPGEFDITSNFGSRTDPFTRGLAMHTGIDFRAPTGSPVRATASGKVVEAGWMGGYGNMVEIDHGNGLTSRYAHLSAITVAVGEAVAKGGTIGRVGSTGRSTGPHLHYETRVDGEPADPMRFIRAGQRLTGN
jgi:murein DD-endopeptidase MepM/ murein hydrolase activator NlpD